ncbi:MAG: helix-turn-helix domain-containing protein [Clostridia bacterium]|nr:helix-turn-helix domain-containing protein [Clostridia bacterium]
MKNNFANILKTLRLEKNIGQVELAEKINVSKGVISLWENGLREPKLSNLIALAKYFEVSLDYLAGLTEF